MARERYFFDIPIYRTSSVRFYNDINAAVARNEDGYGERFGGVLPHPIATAVRESFRINFCAPWNFNQAVGWVRLYAFGREIGGQVWRRTGKRWVVNPRHKRFECLGKGFEVACVGDESSDDLREMTRAKLTELTREGMFAGRVIDLEAFDNVAPFIDWTKLLRLPSIAPW